jgi:hypothetical protein
MTRDPNPEERKRIVDDALSKLKKFQPADAPSDIDRLKDKAKAITLQLAKETNLITDALRANGQSQDRTMLAQHISKGYVSAFSKWHKDELIMLLTIIHTEAAMGEM